MSYKINKLILKSSIYTIASLTFLIIYFVIIDWKIYPYSDTVQKLSYLSKRNAVSIYNEIRSNGIIQGIENFKTGLNKSINADKTIYGIQHHLSVETISANNILIPYFENQLSPPGYLSYIKEQNFFIVTGVGKIYIFDGSIKSFYSIASNLEAKFKSQNYVVIDEKSKQDISMRFGVKGIYFDKLTQKIYVSYHKLLSDKYCYTMGIDVADVLNTNGNIDLNFREFFTGNFCQKNFNGHESSGKITAHDEKIIFTIGSMDSRDSKYSSDFSNHMGSIIEIYKDGTSKVIAKGLRNSQGLAVVNNGIFVSAQGPMGGDIFTKVSMGDNFGWPSHSYGFDYEYRDIYLRPMSPKFTEPTFYFTPSIAASPLFFYNGPEFTRFKGKFILGSLKNKTLYILDYRNDLKRVLSIEGYEIGERVRDIAMDQNGLIYVISDEGNLLILSRAPSDIKDR